MTLSRGDKLRYLGKQRGSMPFSAHQHLHRRSVPVDEWGLRAVLPQDEVSGLVRCTSYSPGEAQRESWASDSVNFSGSDSDSVGKSSLARIFGGVEDCADAEETGEGADGAGYPRSRGPAAPRASPLWPPRWGWRRDDSQWLQNHCMKMGDAYIIVYSVTDKVSFEKASELRIQLRRARQTEDIPIILVGNKSDLVRSREVSVD
ncbi:RAD protein, partial [Eolophus roseicapillus]|nr:RAD protein [Eolophus roseicapilla]